MPDVQWRHLRMVAQPRQGWFPVFQDLEKVRSADEFARGVYDVVSHYLGRWKLVANAAKLGATSEEVDRLLARCGFLP